MGTPDILPAEPTRATDAPQTSGLLCSARVRFRIGVAETTRRGAPAKPANGANLGSISRVTCRFCEDQSPAQPGAGTRGPGIGVLFQVQPAHEHVVALVASGGP